MKKKIFALMTAVVLVAILCLSLVACDDNENGGNDGNDLNPITFSDNMSKDEIIEQLGKVENCTIEILYNGENRGKYCLNSTHFYLADQYGNELHQFLEGNRTYDLILYADGETYVSIKDYSEYDFDKSSLSSINVVDGWIENWFVYHLNKDEDVVVENGNLKYERTSTDDEEGTVTVTYILKDCNTTEMPAVPEEFKDYKNMDATEGVITFELSDDGTYYTLEEIDEYVKSYEVPSTYNGMPVTKFEESCSSAHLKTLTLPTNIVKMNSWCGHDVEDGELHIIYKGTKAQWAAIENSSVWSGAEGVRITCSDGDYVVSTEE